MLYSIGVTGKFPNVYIIYIAGIAIAGLILFGLGAWIITICRNYRRNNYQQFIDEQENDDVLRVNNDGDRRERRNREARDEEEDPAEDGRENGFSVDDLEMQRNDNIDFSR